ncbi:sulfur carrier protein ThiS [Metabacillus fastidiosus]|uniref:Sulfur carrier protein ThiS n=2 Tax=Metabacillus fastidiosus TaxID=1458 RepID=A0ABU6P1Q5_9BACI|nr:sulfur carrier protein ThiS [Metabacillus fastidiosus]MED4403216.1 sulfur carrier protein ThiS [Metabacillus fastidiosus]MED4455451.1 sulfur carrier protein ThiS [Metabacillus fastidiosus]MED4461640.1 sulfur carrier protein ThiS [Metabacillus fastidiosus]MED4533625.1 sulfur carrier protein ThiS [Metabacillus fastidiosus]
MKDEVGLMVIKLNGENVELTSSIRVITDLLSHYELENRLVIVEQNKEIISKEDYDTREVNQGDEIELVHFVGGG